MHRYVSPVLDADLGTLAPEVDPTAPGGGAHLNFDVILRRCGLAWITMLDELGFGRALIVPRLEVDYHREVGAGELVIETVVVSVGRTSFRLRLDVTQDGELAAQAEVVLVALDDDGQTPKPLSSEQRAALAPHLG